MNLLLLLYVYFLNTFFSKFVLRFLEAVMWLCFALHVFIGKMSGKPFKKLS